MRKLCSRAWWNALWAVVDREMAARSARSQSPAIAEAPMPDAKLFEAACKAYPATAIEDAQTIKRAWLGLTAEERTEAVAALPRFLELAAAHGRRQLLRLAVYLAERRWMVLPASATAPASDEASPLPRATGQQTEGTASAPCLSPSPPLSRHQPAH